VNTAKARPSTKKQRQAIAVGCSRIGIDAELRHLMLKERFGVESSTLLTCAQASEFLDELRGRGFAGAGKNTWRPRREKQASVYAKQKRSVPCVERRQGAKVVRMASPEELEKIAALAGLIEWRVENGLALWMKSRMGVDRVRTAHDAWLVIEGLKKMFENRMKKDHGKDWWLKKFEDPAVDAYIGEHCPAEYR
jgi:hypothetical protein